MPIGTVQAGGIWIEATKGGSDKCICAVISGDYTAHAFSQIKDEAGTQDQSIFHSWK